MLTSIVTTSCLLTELFRDYKRSPHSKASGARPIGRAVLFTPMSPDLMVVAERLATELRLTLLANYRLHALRGEEQACRHARLGARNFRMLEPGSDRLTECLPLL